MDNLNLCCQFTGLWSNNTGNILLIEYDKNNKFIVSFASGKNKGPILRKALNGKASIFMPAIWMEQLDSLIVYLIHEGNEPTLHLTYDYYHDYSKGDCLIPGLSTNYSKHNEQIQEISWIKSLEPYFRIPKKNQDDVTLFKYLNYYKNLKD